MAFEAVALAQTNYAALAEDKDLESRLHELEVLHRLVAAVGAPFEPIADIDPDVLNVSKTTALEQSIAQLSAPQAVSVLNMVDCGHARLGMSLTGRQHRSA